VSVAVFTVHEVVVVFKIFVASVVGRVYVNHVYAASVGKVKSRECMEVVALDERVVESVVYLSPNR
jgi:hypothetical protein